MSSSHSRSDATGTLKPRVVHPDRAEALRPFGIDMRVLLGSADTGGAFSALIAEVKPGEGPPPHLHRDREEYFFVLDGTYQLVVDGQEQTVGPGTLAFIPRGTLHAFKNVGTTSGRMLEWTIPGDNEQYFRAVHDMQNAGGFDPERFAEINQRFATEFAGD